jgi:hypothetical protein
VGANSQLPIQPTGHVRKFLHRSVRSSGQALVEFALSAVLIFTLLAATVDLGLIYFTVQTLRSAAQEGATFGSYPVVCPDSEFPAVCTQYGTNVAVDRNVPEIQSRVRLSAGTQTTGNFVNLLDLNNDGTPDVDANGVRQIVNGRDVLNDFINTELLLDANGDGDPLNENTPSRTVSCSPTGEMRNAGFNCYIRVKVSYSYRLVFPLVPAFADRVTIPVTFIMPIRSSFIG